MNREDIQKLLGGYATGTLTPEEQQALFAAALEDQELFDALGREQALCDLLRDPGNKAELLAALDTTARERGGFWAWLRTPLVAGLATAAVAAVAVVAVWQGTRGKQVAPAPAAAAMVAELRAPEVKEPDMKTPDVTAPEAVETKTPQAIKMKAHDVTPEAATRRKSEIASLREPTDTVPEMSRKEFPAAVNSPGPRPLAPIPPPLPATAAAPPNQPAFSTQSVEVTAEASSLDVKDVKKTAVAAPAQTARLNTLQDKLTPAKPALGLRTDGLRTDARTLFYGNTFLPRPNALVQPFAGGGQSQSELRGSGTAIGAASGNLARQVGAASSLGVRVSILRGDEEAAVTTVLNAGESVRLKLTPNEDGFLYVATRDANVWKMVASGPVQRLKPFETPPLPFSGSGTRQVYVMLSRQPQTLSPQALPGLARNNLVETVADQDRATYVVAALATDAPQQIVQPINLTYR